MRKHLVKGWGLAVTVGLLVLSLRVGLFASSNSHMNWTKDNLTQAFNAQNRRGRNVVYSKLPFTPSVGISRQALNSDVTAPPRSGYEDDGGAVSGNFHLTIPVVSLSGRGLDLNLALNYNSLVWSSIANQRVFNVDADWPAPGWYLGFGKLSWLILMDPDGTRHPIQHVDATHRRTSDGTWIDIEDEPCSIDVCQSKVRYPDGRLVEFTGANNENVDRQPTKIIDRNGNFITISYLSPSSQALSSIVDTVGRQISFVYDQKTQHLIAIKGPSISGGTRDLVRLHYLYAGPYTDHSAKIPGLQDGAGFLVDAIYYPANGTGFWFGGNKDVYVGGGPNNMTGCYGRDGQLKIVNWQVGMTMQGTTDTEQGSVAPGRTVRTRYYTYISDAPNAAPRISKVTETWQGNPQPAVTLIDVKHDQQYREVTITYPDGSQNLQVADESPGQVDSGLVYMSVVKSRDGRALSTQITEWEEGADSIPRVHRVKNQNESGVTGSTVFEYGSRNEITAINEYGYDAALLRRTTTDYLKDPQYEAQHLFDLPFHIYVSSGTDNVPISRTDFAYDETALEEEPGIGQHLQEFDPSQVAPSPYVHSARGNLTSTVSYADAQNAKASLTLHITYDIAGNIVSAARWNGAEVRYSYSSATQFSLPDTITTRSSDPSSKVRMTEGFTYNMNVGLPVTHHDTNGLGTTLTYDPSGNLQQIESQGKATEDFTHDYDNLQVLHETRDSTSATIARSLSKLDGRGMTVRTEQLSNNGKMNAQQFKYDFAGQRIAETLPYSGNAPLQWITYSYDALGRLTAKIMPDGSATRRFYDEPGRPPAADVQAGITIRTKDAWGREQWSLFDVRNRLVEVVEPDPSTIGGVLAGVGFRTKYSYDALDNLTHVEQGDQTRDYAYDSISRLVALRVPEQSATLSDAGYADKIAERKWSEVRTYDERTGQLASITDARGIQKLIDYGTDPLGRVQKTWYADQRSLAGPVGNQSHRSYSVIPVEAAEIHYLESGDLSRPARITVGQTITQSFQYDTSGRIKSVLTAIDVSLLPGAIAVGVGQLQLPNRALSLVTFYDYDDAGRLKSVGESEALPFASPAQLFQVLNNASNKITLGYGTGGRILSSDVQLTDFHSLWRISGIEYNPAGLITARQFSNSAPSKSRFGLLETFDYDKNSLLESEHAVTRMYGGPQLNNKLFDTAYRYTRIPQTSKHIVLSQPKDQVGQLTRQIDLLRPQGNQDFSYDLLGRLNQATLGKTSNAQASGYESLQTYAYDRYGNRIGVDASASPESCGNPTCPLSADRRDGWAQLSVDPSTNHIVQDGIVYDEMGNVLAARRLDGHIQNYQYDVAGRLSAILDDSGKVLEQYIYGLDRRRLLTLDSTGSAIAYGWDSSNLIAEYDVKSGAHRFNVRDHGITLASFYKDTLGRKSVEYRVVDHQSVRLTISTDAEGGSAGPSKAATTVTNSRPFGNPAPGQAPSPELFPNYLRSATTGLDYALNRFYDSEQGRFLQPDPLGNGATGGFFANPQRQNLYAYVTNDPINKSDPSGLLPRLNIAGCGYLPGDTWVLGGCASVLPEVGSASLESTAPSGTGWGVPVDFRFRLASSAVFKDDVTAAQRELILEALIHVEATGAGQNLANLLGSDQIVIGRLHELNATGDAINREVMLGVPFEGNATYTTANGNYPFTLDRVLAHELGHLTGLGDVGPGSMLNVNAWENQIMRENAPWQPDRTAY